MESALSSALAEACGLGTGEGVLVGVSGGADSVALLEMLCALNGRGGWSLRLHAAHLNHKLRGEAAEADAALVVAHCQRLDVPCTVASADVAGRAAAEGISVEQAGRLCRFELFEQLCNAHDLRWVALGHHADDQAETVLHRIARGTGLRGLGGMRIVRPLRPDSAVRLVRPLLGFTRVQLETYLGDKPVAFREDASNRSPTHTRNRIRHEVLPLMRERLNPRVDGAFRRLADHAREVDAYVAEQAARRATDIVTRANADGIEVDRAALAREPRVIQAELVRQLLADLGAPQRELSALQMDRILELAAGGQGTRTAPLPGGFLARACYDRLVFERATSSRDKAAYAPFAIPVAPEGTTRLEPVGLEITIERLITGEHESEPWTALRDSVRGCPLEECLDADAVRGPFVIRSPRPGDRFDPLGMGGDTKKLSDFLIDAKVSAERRNDIVLLCDQLGPVWVVGQRIAHRVRLTEGTRNVLHIRVGPTVEKAVHSRDKKETTASR
jgi:tRNA(Ile)-lysidine synthase